MAAIEGEPAGRSDAVGDRGAGTAIDTLDIALGRAGDAAGDPVPDRTPGRASGSSWPRRHRPLLVLVIVLVLVLVVGGGLLAWSFDRPGQSTATTRTYTVTSQTLTRTVAATGTLEPLQQAELSFSSSGTVDAVDVAVGDTVRKGQSLARIDDSSLAVAVTTAKAAVADAESTLAGDLDNDAATTTIASDRASLALKRSQLTQAEQARSAATLTAPFAGTIAAVGISKGDSVAGGSGSGTQSASSGGIGTGSGTGSGNGGAASASGTGSGSVASSAITLISRGTFTVDTSVSNADLSSVKRGLQATITPSGTTTTVFGTVSTVGVMAGSTTSGSSGTSSGSGAAGTGSQTFPVTIKVTGTHRDLLPGSAVDVSITVRQLTDAIAVPTVAISSTGGATTVRKLVGDTVTVTPVTLGQSFGETTQITSGLRAGDRIEIAGFTAARAAGTTGTGGYRQRSGSGGFGGGGFGGGQGGQTGQNGQGGQTGQGGQGR